MKRSKTRTETFRAVKVRVDYDHTTRNGNGVLRLVAVTDSGDIEGPIMCPRSLANGMGLSSTSTADGKWTITVRVSSDCRRAGVTGISRTDAE